MEPIVIDIIKQAPSLAVLALIVKWFLAHISVSDEKHTKAALTAVETMTELREGCHQVQRDSISAMSDLREELGRTRQVLSALSASSAAARSAGSPT